MASLPKDSGKYHRVIFRKTYDGNQRSKTFYFRKDEYTRTEVKEWKKRKELAFKGGDWQPWDEPSRITKGHDSIADKIAEYLRYARRIYADSTYDIRKRYLELFADYVGRNRTLSSVTTELANNWINASGLTYPTKKNRLKTLSVFFDWTDAGIGGLEVIARQSEKQKYFNKQHKSFITETQLGKVLHEVRGSTRSTHSRYDLRQFYRLAFYTTRRRSDLLHLKPSWIMDDEPLMRLGDDEYLPKSQIVEYVPLLDNAWQILLDYKEETSNGDPIFKFTGDFVTKQFQDALEKAVPRMKGKVSLHNLRDSGIMYLIYEKDLDLKHVRQMTGHRTLRSLELYTHNWAEKTYKQLKK
jgi:integrase